MSRNRSESYRRFLASDLNTMIMKLDLARAYPNEPKRIREAASTGCRSLGELLESRDFRRDLGTVASMREENIEDVRAILEDLEDFERFLRIEEEILVRGGVHSTAITILLHQCRMLREETQYAEFSVDFILTALYRLREETCSMITDHVKQEEREAFQKTLVLSIGGVLFVGLNVSTIALTSGLSAPAAAVSGIFGAKLIEAAVTAPQ